ncbi:neurotrophin 1 [Papilio machaon]|uniref:neurotrophin 1 n=1 Tax=Papilio machaon TaxID=76193 RepID=UPI001E664D17|nr:neurotrophin 1 [Papilio machaon]
MAYISRVVFILAVTSAVRVQDDLESSDPHEVMIAQESRSYHTFVAPSVRIIKPSGVINSHRPQYNLDSLEEDLANLDVDNFFEATTRKNSYKAYNHQNSRNKENIIRDAVLRALERKDHVGKFAQILPIIRAMSGSQRVALASLVASQVSIPPGRTPLNLSQVRSMFGNENNSTTELMLPILLDMANLIRRAVRPGKEQRDVKLPLTLSQTEYLRRSFIDDTPQSDEFDPGVEEFQPKVETTKAPLTFKNRNTRTRPQRTQTTNKSNELPDKNTAQNNKTADNSTLNTKDDSNATLVNKKEDNNNATTSSTRQQSRQAFARSRSMNLADNATLDLTADSTNQSLHELPVAEKLRSLNRYIDRKGNVIRRATFSPKPPPRRTTVEPLSRRRPFPSRKPIPAESKCEMFTNNVCLHYDDYPTEAIIQSIRRNKAAGALLADVKDPGEGAVDGITQAQEAKYTADHYLVSNRRGDTANRDFASAGEAGFMCPSTVKYARPQRARATSGQWKFIVNTGEHTQTLRLEKCLKPKESCTYLTDNFKSKCVQVYNYHRLLTWDQQNGLHMDIFKVPTCCSCHIEGYSVSFPPLGQRIHETSSEHFPGEDLSPEQGNQAFEAVQSTIHKPALSKVPNFSFNKHLDTFPSLNENQNSIPGPLFSDVVNDEDEFNNVPLHSLQDSYGNAYFTDSLNQPSSVRNVRKPSISRYPLGGSGFNTATLPSFLEPPTPGLSSFSYSKDSSNKYKTTENLFKRGISRQNYRPIRKKITEVSDDLLSSGTSVVSSLSGDNIDNEDDLILNQQSDIRKNNVKVTISPKLYGFSTGKPLTSSIRPNEQNQITKEETLLNSKRINYNYHPIIDFFEEDEREGNESIDREDIVPEFIPSTESEWKPLNRPISTT